MNELVTLVIKNNDSNMKKLEILTAVLALGKEKLKVMEEYLSSCPSSLISAKYNGVIEHEQENE